MWIMVAGPYRTGANRVQEREHNLAAINRVAYEIFPRGHTPIVGVNLALPIIEAIGPDSYDDVMMPISLAAAERCDGIIRIGGESTSADDEVERVRKHGGAVFSALENIPQGSL